MEQARKRKSKMVSAASVILVNLVLLVSCHRVRRVLLLFSFFDALGTRVGISQGHNQASIQTDPELRYLVDRSHSHFNTGASSLGEEDNQQVEDEHGGFEVLKSPIKFEPPELDFKDQPIGLPVLRRVNVYNLNAQSSIQMLSISGNTIHFHCSFFADKVIPPSGNTSFDVVFLGRDEGLVENTLYIHTSAGSFRFNVRATGTPNPYRLKPLIGVKMPLNSSYSPMIQLHNPHPEPIQVLEMYSSGGDLHLELPGGEDEGPQALWQIPPYQTKSVMKANFLARLENNHTAYIRIKTNTTGAEFLYLPLEVEVSSQPGIYCPQEIIDFGLVPSNSQPRTLKLLVLNSGQKAIQIQNVIATPVNEALSINFRPFKISPDTMRPTVIAEVTLDPSMVSEDGIYSGKIVIKSKNSQFKATIPYRVQVLTGCLAVEDKITQFRLEESGEDEGPIDMKMSRSFTVRNRFKQSVAVHNLTLAPEAAKYFRIKNFQPHILGPGKSCDLFVISLTPEAWKKKVLDSWVALHTNISSMYIQLIIFHGRVDKFFPGSPSQKFLDFGTLGMAEERDAYFTILNRNPVTLNLKHWGANLTGTLLEMMGVERGGEAEIVQRSNYSGMSRSLKIPPFHYMVFRIGIYTPSTEGDTNATVFVATEYESFHVPFKFRVAKGSLSTVPGELIFEPAFPGKTVELKLKVFSSFLEEMITDSVTTKPPSDQFSFRHAVQEGRTVIMSSEKSFVGRVIFDPGANCREDESCYSGFSLDTKVGKDWFQGCALERNVGEADVALAHGLYDRYRSSITPSSSFNITLNLDTNKVRGFLFNARAKMVWPRVTQAEEGGFPLTMVGNRSYAEVMLNNPTDSDLYIHLVPFSVYPDSNEVFKTLPSWMKSQFWGNLSNLCDDLRVFKIINVHDNSNGTLIGFSDDVESNTGVPLHRQTKAFILSAGHKAKVRIRFQPTSIGKFRHGLYVRNNLTGIEMAVFSGEAVDGEFKFGKFRHNHRPEEGIVEFDMEEGHLKDCEDRLRQRSRYSPPLLIVKRTIRMKNTGLIPLYVNGFEIEGLKCEGYGFKILECGGFDLMPSETREIDIAFSPDFTLSKVKRTLAVDSNIGCGKVNFTLIATLPPHLLAVCGSVVPRPSWEYVLYYVVNIVMFFTLAIVVISAAVESDRIVRFSGFSGSALIIQKSDQGSRRKDASGEAFDLRKVGDKLEQEMRERDLSAKPKRQKLTQAQSSEKVVNSLSTGGDPLWSRILVKIRGVLFASGSSYEPAPIDEAEKEEEKDVAEKAVKEEEKEGNRNSTSSPSSVRRRKQAQPKQTKAAKRNSGPFLSFRNVEEMAEETSSTTTEGELEVEPCFETTNLAADSPEKSQLSGSKKKQKMKEKKKPTPSQVQQPKAKKEISPKQEQPCKKSLTPPQCSKVEAEPAKRKPASAQSSKKMVKPGAVVEDLEVSKNVRNVSTASSVSDQSTPTPPTSPFFNSPSHQTFTSSKSREVTPVGKILPEIKKPENRFGPVGTKPLHCNNSNILEDACNDWNEVSLNDSRFGLVSASRKGEQAGKLLEFVGNQPQLASVQGTPALNVSSGFVNLNSRDFYGSREDNQSELRNLHHREDSLMRSLQMERRQRTQAYLQSATATDWPGFDENNSTVLTSDDYIRNLWDSSRNATASTAQPGWNAPTTSTMTSSTAGGYGVWTGSGSVWSPEDVGNSGQNFGFRSEEDRSVFGLNDPSISSIWSSDSQQQPSQNHTAHLQSSRVVHNDGHNPDAWNTDGYGLRSQGMRRHQ